MLSPAARRAARPGKRDPFSTRLRSNTAEQARPWSQTLICSLKSCQVWFAGLQRSTTSSRLGRLAGHTFLVSATRAKIHQHISISDAHARSRCLLLDAGAATRPDHGNRNGVGFEHTDTRCPWSKPWKVGTSRVHALAFVPCREARGTDPGCRCPWVQASPGRWASPSRRRQTPARRQRSGRGGGRGGVRCPATRRPRPAP